jgi:hypothetical protein
LQVKAKRRVSCRDPAESLGSRRVDFPPRRADSDFRNSGPQLMSVSVFRRPPQRREKRPEQVMHQKLAPVREFQLDLPAPVFSTPNRQG